MQDRKVLITGSSSKIGLILSRYFQSTEYYTYLHYNNSFDKIQGLANKNSFFIEADFYDVDRATDIFEETFKKHGYPDVIINNAAYFVKDNFANFSTDTLQKHLNINLITPLNIISKIYKKMSDKSVVINIFDYFHNRIPNADIFSYAISKNIYASVTQKIAIDIAPVRVCGIGLPSVICDENENPDDFILRATNNLMHKKVEMKQVIDTIDFFIKNTAVTGQIINIDNGNFLLKSLI